VDARKDLDVVVCGGGRTGHLNAVLFKQVPGVRVSLLTTRQDVIARHHENSEGLTAFVPDATPLRARLDAVGSEAALVAQADLVVLTVPAHVRAAWLRGLVHALPRDKPVYVGAIPGFCGFDWLAEQILAERPNAVIWGMKDVPHTAFDLHPGVSVRMGGAKQMLHVGTHARETPGARAALQGLLQRLYAAPVQLLDHFLEITLTQGNPIMHSSVVYGLAGPYSQWHGRAFPAPVCWWTDCTELGAYFLQRSDEECQRLCQAVQERLGVDLSSVKPLHQEIVEAYGDQIRDPRRHRGPHGPGPHPARLRDRQGEPGLPGRRGLRLGRAGGDGASAGRPPAPYPGDLRLERGLHAGPARLRARLLPIHLAGLTGVA
jgi:hypothetical protein